MCFHPDFGACITAELRQLFWRTNSNFWLDFHFFSLALVNGSTVILFFDNWSVKIRCDCCRDELTSLVTVVSARWSEASPKKMLVQKLWLVSTVFYGFVTVMVLTDFCFAFFFFARALVSSALICFSSSESLARINILRLYSN